MSKVKVNKLSLRNKKIFSRYLGLSNHELAVYAFENIYIWKKLFSIRWATIRNNLCVFFQDKVGCFLYLPPLGGNINAQVLQECFRLMDSYNKNKEISRIENITQEEVSFYQGLGYNCAYKSSDYTCLNSSLIALKGNRFKSKRACYNYFIKNYAFEYLPFNIKFSSNCLELHAQWAKQRKDANPDLVYQGMLKDSQACLEILLRDYTKLNLIGRVVKVDGKIKAFTFGFKLNTQTFCILYEVADLSIKGLAQFIFREFCRQLSEYKYINIMDDSGLENLKRVKLSYHPAKLISAYIASR